jgi:hypothetical protein
MRTEPVRERLFTEEAARGQRTRTNDVGTSRALALLVKATMKHVLLQGVVSLALILPSVAIGGGCEAHFATVDGYEAEYADAPANIDAYPHYAFQDGYIYDVNGRWYHRHENRWVVYRQPPREVAHLRR